MDLLLFVQDFDVVSYLSGAATVAAACGIKPAIRRFRGDSKDAIADRAMELLAEYQPKYAQYQDKLDEFNKKRDELVHDFTIAFPEYDANKILHLSKTDSIVENLNRMLGYLNSLQNSHLTKKQLDEIGQMLKDDWAGRSVDSQRESTFRDKSKFENALATRKKMKNMMSRLTREFESIKADIAEAEEKFDRIFLEKIPPALFHAEKAYENLKDYVADPAHSTFHFLSTYSAGTTYNLSRMRDLEKKAETAIRRLSKHVKNALEFSDIARSQAAKKRTMMRRYEPLNKKQQDAFTKALESLMDAESYVYDSGNPAEKFEEIIAPYHEYLDLRVPNLPKSDR